MSLEEFAWGTAALAAANAVWMRLAITLFDFGNQRNKLLAALLWSIPTSALVHVGFRFGPIFYIFALMIFYAALLKWYDLEVGQTLKVAFVTPVLDAATYIILIRAGILPGLESAAVEFRSVFA